MADKICKRCNKKIKKDEKGVTWITFKGKKELEVIHWHFQCFLDWKNESLENGAKKLFSKTMSTMYPQIKGAKAKIDEILYNAT